MVSKSIKTILALVSSTILLALSYNVIAQEGDTKTAESHVEKKKEGFNAKEVIFGHIMDAHEFHFFEYEGSDGQKHPITIPLPVVLYSPQKGLSFFMSSAFEHWARFALGDYEGAIAAAEHAVRLDPAHPEAHFELGRAYAAVGRLGEARLAFEACVRLSPTNEAAKAALAALS